MFTLICFIFSSSLQIFPQNIHFLKFSLLDFESLVSIVWHRQLTCSRVGQEARHASPQPPLPACSLLRLANGEDWLGLPTGSDSYSTPLAARLRHFGPEPHRPLKFLRKFEHTTTSTHCLSIPLSNFIAKFHAVHEWSMSAWLATRPHFGPEPHRPLTFLRKVKHTTTSAHCMFMPLSNFITKFHAVCE